MKDLVSARRRPQDGGGEPPSRRTAGGGGGGGDGHRISPTLSTAAIAAAQNAVEAAHASGDYRHQSVADLIRGALRAYWSGMPLSQPARSGRQKRHTVELPGDLFEQYEKLPSRSRGVIIERALLSLLARGFEETPTPAR